MDYLCLMSEFTKLLQSAIDGRGFKTTQSAAEKIGVHPEYLRQILRGARGAPSDDVVVKLAHGLFPQGSEQNIMTMKFLIAAAIDRAKDESTKSAWGNAASGWPDVQKAREEWDIHPSRTSVRENGPEYRPPEPAISQVQPSQRKIPIYSSVIAGSGEHSVVTGELEDEITLPSELRDGAWGLVVVGDSMNGPESWLSPGDYAIFEPINGEDPGPNEVLLLCVEGWESCAVKRFRKEPSGQVVLISDNPAYPPILISSGTGIRVLGTFAGSWRPAKRRARMTLTQPGQTKKT